MNEDQMLKEMMEYQSDLDWFIANYDELAVRHPDKYIAILGGEVIENNTSIEGLEKVLQKKYDRHLSHVLVEFIYKEAPNFVL
ncbi:MAG: hypothetical protein IIB44_06060 [Candidatus Marinimicrobia bacterium]|nr:hypothetical protein [Candidatus Neomarinimicrobiota bacterium]